MIAVLSHLISEQFEKATGIKALPLKPYQRLDAPVAAHADMLLCVIEKNLFCYKDYYQENIGLFNKIEKEGYKVIQIEKECNKLYPKDIALNVLIIGNMLFCNKKYTASEILEFAEKNKYIIINVNQGYSACSTLVVDKKTVITADIGIKRALEKENIEPLRQRLTEYYREIFKEGAAEESVLSIDFDHCSLQKSRQTACAEMPSFSPVKPSLSSVVAFTLTALTGMPSAFAIFSAICGR